MGVYSDKGWWRQLLRAISLLFLLTIFVSIAWFFVPIKDALFGVPFAAKKQVDVVSDDQFYVQFQVPCNRVYSREVGLLINPAIKIDSVGEAQSAILGKIELTVNQGEHAIEKFVDLSNSGWTLDTDGVRSKVIYRYPALGSVFCGSQEIEIKAKDINFSLDEHSVTGYVSRDRRK